MPEPRAPVVFLDRLKEVRLSVSLGVLGVFLVTAYYTGVQANAAYESYHRKLAREEATAVVMAQSQSLREQIQQTQKTADESSHKLDQMAEQVAGVQVFLAVQEVRNLQLALTEHDRHDDGTSAWRRERDRLLQQLAMAVEYRDCLRRTERNCTHLRGW